MVAGHVDLPLDRIAEICRKYRVRELSLFGSALRDDFRPDSDIDLLVDFLPNHGVGLFEYLQCQDELANLFHRRVDLIQKSGLKRFIRSEIMQSSRVIYAN